MPAKPTLKPQPYPYEIPSIEYLKERGKNLDPWDVQEFFRIEALLRSEKVAKLYEQTFETGKSKTTFGNLEFYVDFLEKNYKVSLGWRVLKGIHHNLILMSETRKGYFTRHQPYKDSGIFDLKAELARGRTALEGEKRFWRILKDSLDSGNPQSLYLQIDASYPTRRILDSLKIILESQKAEINKTPEDSPWFSLIKSKSKTVNREHLRKLDIQTWIDYFRCYDLWHGKDKSFGQIALKVYGDSQTKYEAAEKAVKRVRILIHYAETHNWPPPKNFQNKEFPLSPPQ